MVLEVVKKGVNRSNLKECAKVIVKGGCCQTAVLGV